MVDEMTPVPVETVSSYARRTGDSVRVVLTLSDDLRDRVGGRLTKRQVFLRLRRKVTGADGEVSQDNLRVPVEVTPGAQPRLVAEVPVESVPSGTWNLALRVGRDGPVLPLEARLLTTDPHEQPLALLVGPKPRTAMPEPAPR